MDKSINLDLHPNSNPLITPPPPDPPLKVASPKFGNANSSSSSFGDFTTGFLKSSPSTQPQENSPLLKNNFNKNTSNPLRDKTLNTINGQKDKIENLVLVDSYSCEYDEKLLVKYSDKHKEENKKRLNIIDRYFPVRSPLSAIERGKIVYRRELFESKYVKNRLKTNGPIAGMSIQYGNKEAIPTLKKIIQKHGNFVDRVIMTAAHGTNYLIKGDETAVIRIRNVMASCFMRPPPLSYCEKVWRILKCVFCCQCCVCDKLKACEMSRCCCCPSTVSHGDKTPLNSVGLDSKDNQLNPKDGYFSIFQV